MVKGCAHLVAKMHQIQSGHQFRASTNDYVHYRLTFQLMKMSKNREKIVKNANHDLHIVTSLNNLFCPVNPKPKDISFTVI